MILLLLVFVSDPGHHLTLGYYFKRPVNTNPILPECGMSPLLNLRELSLVHIKYTFDHPLKKILLKLILAITKNKQKKIVF